MVVLEFRLRQSEYVRQILHCVVCIVAGYEADKALHYLQERAERVIQ